MIFGMTAMVEEIALALQEEQNSGRLSPGELQIRDFVVQEHRHLQKSSMMFLTNGAKPLVVVDKMKALLKCDNMPDIGSSVSATSRFSIGNVSFFAIGYKDGSLLVFSCKSDSAALSLVAQYSYTTSEKGIQEEHPEILCLRQQPIDCLNRFQDNLVYMWVSFGSKVLLTTFKTEQTNGALGVFLEFDINAQNLGKIFQVETLDSSYGRNTMTCFHLISSTAVRVIALDTRHVLFWAEKVCDSVREELVIVICAFESSKLGVGWDISFYRAIKPCVLS